MFRMAVEPIEMKTDVFLNELKGADQRLKRAKAETLLYATNKMAYTGILFYPILLFQTLYDSTHSIHEVGQLQGRDVLRRYKAILQVQSQWEEGHFYLGKYYDHLFTCLQDKKKTKMQQHSSETENHKLIPAIVREYGESLKFSEVCFPFSLFLFIIIIYTTRYKI